MKGNDMNIKEAIQESSRRSQITSAEFEGNEIDLRLAIDELYDGEFDTAIENDGTIDIWGFQEDAPAWSMDWRINVRLV